MGNEIIRPMKGSPPLSPIWIIEILTIPRIGHMLVRRDILDADPPIAVHDPIPYLTWNLTENI